MVNLGDSQSTEITIAIIGDVHDQWEAADNHALENLPIDLALFVGDFGNESVWVVEAIAKLNKPKAVILGNHDAWYSASEWGRKQSPYDHSQEDRVQQQLDLLGNAHVGYGYLDFPALGLAVVGARPFSWGSSEWRNQDFYQQRYGVGGFAESAARITAAAAATNRKTIILLGHNGPFGLGDRVDSPCGKDWRPEGGDFGDPDLTAAIAQTRSLGKQIPLVTFGHMHHNLRLSNQQRQITAIDEYGTVYVNAASVPRIKELSTGRARNFTLVTLRSGQVVQAKIIWVDAKLAIVSETITYRQVATVDAET
ncbi:metallophosphoesterase [Thalassoporum mexicanum PCC 7367]|uniref:TIGR04168 family protein n=1 Tax=Thalassoporum mexicanum TaxID=3457544 RepID=UPI00029FC08F|nr:TIGR04168 family protein [Pseudanabaena sp. PCC 7367]AFY71155.1 metallophosphoesterase [Pseudanabaena sp. PCC 7367]